MPDLGAPAGLPVQAHTTRGIAGSTPKPPIRYYCYLDALLSSKPLSESIQTPYYSYSQVPTVAPSDIVASLVRDYS